MLKKIITAILILSLCQTLTFAQSNSGTSNTINPTPARRHHGQVRIKELTKIENLNNITVSGPGIVIGLNGTGDSSSITAQLLKRYDITLPIQFKAGGSAIVMVTATIKPFMSFGDITNVEVSILGDASSLHHGRLLSTPLLSPTPQGIKNKDTYMIAQGPIALASEQNSPVNGTISNGGSMVRKMRQPFHDIDHFILVLHDADFETARNIVLTLNDSAPRILGKENSSSGEFLDLGAYPIARSINAKRIRINIPKEQRKDIVAYISKIQAENVSADIQATVTIDTKTNLIAFSGNIIVLPTTVLFKGVSINTSEKRSTKNTMELGQTGSIKETPLPLQNLTNDLYNNGWTASDVIEIVLALHRSGAIKAKVIVN